MVYQSYIIITQIIIFINDTHNVLNYEIFMCYIKDLIGKIFSLYYNSIIASESMEYQMDISLLKSKKLQSNEKFKENKHLKNNTNIL